MRMVVGFRGILPHSDNDAHIAGSTAVYTVATTTRSSVRMAGTMKAVQYASVRRRQTHRMGALTVTYSSWCHHQPRNFTITEVPIPKPGDDEVLLKGTRTIIHSDRRSDYGRTYGL